MITMIHTDLIIILHLRHEDTVPACSYQGAQLRTDFSIYGNFLVNIILTEKSPQGGTCHLSSDDTDQYLLTAGSGETSILYMVNQCHASS